MIPGVDVESVPKRYSRQVLFPGIGNSGQSRLMQSHVVLVGCGALGTVQASLLVRAGVGRIRIIDRDFVEESNLQRQILFDEDDVRSALPKAVAAANKLRPVNSLVEVESVVDDVHVGSIDRLLKGVDLILDATDNFETRYLINDYAVHTKTPWVYGACVGSYGLTFPIVPGDTPCLRCVFEHAPSPGTSPSCDTAGVIGPIVAVVAGMQVAEALKILCGAGDKVARTLTTVDLWDYRWDTIKLPSACPECPCCGLREFSYLDGTLGADATTLCGRNSVQIRARGDHAVNLDDLERRLAAVGTVERTRYLLRASIDDLNITVFPDGRAIVVGTQDPAIAKSMYARYVGM